jgi:hypothetical protein
MWTMVPMLVNPLVNWFAARYGIAKLGQLGAIDEQKLSQILESRKSVAAEIEDSRPYIDVLHQQIGGSLAESEREVSALIERLDRLPCLSSLQCIHHGLAASSLKTIQERIGHALTGSFTLDVYGQMLDWKSNEDAAKGLGALIAKSVTEIEGNLDSGPLTPYKQNDLQPLELEVADNS